MNYFESNIRPKVYLIGLIAAFYLSGCASQGKKVEPSHTSAPSVERSPSSQTPEQRRISNAEHHFTLGQAYSLDGNPSLAIEEYKIALMHDPKSALIRARLASEYIKKGMLTSAMEQCKDSLKIDPNQTDARLMLAGIYSTSRQTELALKEYNRILKQDPAHEEAAIYRAQVLIDSNQGSRAIKGLKKFLKGNPQSVVIWYYLGRAQQQSDDHRGAEKSYLKAFALQPAFIQPGLALGFLYELEGKNNDAIQIYQKVFNHSESTAAANRIATIYLKQEKYRQALPYLEAVRASDPRDVGSLVKLGLVQMELENHQQAIQTFKLILKEHPDSDRVHFYLGTIYEETEKPKSAIYHFQKIKKDSRFFEDAVLHSTYLLKKEQGVSPAKQAIQSAIEKNHKIPSFHIYLASLEEEEGDLSEAIQVLSRSLESFPDNEKVRYYLGSLYDRQGDYKNSLKQMEIILKKNPDNADALNYIGYTWTTQGVRLDDAGRMIQRALVLRPNNGYIQDSWGWHLFIRGKIAEAVVELEKAAKLTPNEPIILQHLGDAYLKKNLRQKALLQYSKALKFAKGDRVRKEIEEKIRSLKSEIARANSEEKRAPASEE